MVLSITSIQQTDKLPLSVGLVGDELFSLGTLLDRFILQSMQTNWSASCLLGLEVHNNLIAGLASFETNLT